MCKGPTDVLLKGSLVEDALRRNPKMKNAIVAALVALCVTVFGGDQDDFPFIWNCDDIKCVDMINVGPPCFKWCPNGMY